MWDTGDRQLLVEILGLDWSQDLANSLLQTLMDQLQQNDSDRIAMIQEKMKKIQTIETNELNQLEAEALKATSLAPPTKREKLDYVSEVEYFSPAELMQTLTPGAKLKARYVQEIWAWIDRYGYLNRYRRVGRAVDGV